ncbi:hypothetical protein C8J57DRAFT_1232641 [Mycena rebaudengoi]|nr:hypothetical protein C8J57DRAFT_1232641 [Mycena rebaudengoi]
MAVRRPMIMIALKRLVRHATHRPDATKARGGAHHRAEGAVTVMRMVMTAAMITTSIRPTLLFSQSSMTFRGREGKGWDNSEQIDGAVMRKRGGDTDDSDAQETVSKKLMGNHQR